MQLSRLKYFGRYPDRSVRVGLSLLALCEELKHAVQSLTRAYQPAKFKHLITLLLVVVLSSTSCAQKKRPIKGETEFQREQNAEFKDASTSPLKKKDLKNFDGLNFFKFDSTYVVTASFKQTPSEKPFKMKTTTDRLPEYIKYGELTFNIKGEMFTLNIYQNQGLIKKEGYENYLFLPFLDETNGLESYGGGRYIDARIPEGDTMVIDFNKAYNPYCAYNDKYSCPIVPRVNYLKTRVEAGVMGFEKG
ncbi:DUF1684 domain-containing protein [Hyunsoonleella rubra]|uniref:DUF1684 domain-containing protein n=1 Tax=Hyunsoonleella rubra TaxID=1737062 RepID=A0ABW5TFT4_9FLAO